MNATKFAKNVTAEAYRDIKADPDITNLVASFHRKYRHSIGEHAREDAAERALLRTLQDHDPSFLSKRTNTAFKFLKWEFDRECRADARQAGPDAPRHPFDVGQLEGDEAPAGRGPAAEWPPEYAAKVAALREAVARYLPKHDRQAVELRFFRGDSFEQVAAEQGVTVEVARARVNRGVAALREVLVEGDDEGIFSAQS